MSKIQPEDLILINRDGVDYQASVNDLPNSGEVDNLESRENSEFHSWTDWRTYDENWHGWEDVTYGNGIFVAVASRGPKRIMYSGDPDVLGWTTKTPPGPDHKWRSIAHGGGYFVAVAEQGADAADDDKIMWCKEDKVSHWDGWSLAKAPKGNWKDIAYGDGKFVAICSKDTDKCLMWATDPAGPWETVAIPDGYWYDIIYADGKWVIVGHDDSSTYDLLWATDPAGSWTGVALPSSKNYKSITYGNGKFVALQTTHSTYDIIAYAEKPEGPWTEVELRDAENFVDITYGSGRFVAIASRKTSEPVMWATDPAGPWTREEALGSLWSAITFGESQLGNKQFVAVAYEGRSRIMANGGIIESPGLYYNNKRVVTEDNVKRDDTIKFVDVSLPAPYEPDPNVIFVQHVELTWSDTCEGGCYAEWQEDLAKCPVGADGEPEFECDRAAFMKYATCLSECDSSLTRESAERLARKTIEARKKGKTRGEIAHKTWYGIGGEFIPDGTYLWKTTPEEESSEIDWVRGPIEGPGSGGVDVDLGEYAKLNDNKQTFVAKEFIGDGSKLTGISLPDFRTLTALS